MSVMSILAESWRSDWRLLAIYALAICRENDPAIFNLHRWQVVIRQYLASDPVIRTFQCETWSMHGKGSDRVEDLLLKVKQIPDGSA